jgi:hypothetical protein
MRERKETVQAVVARNRRWDSYQGLMHSLRLDVIRLPPAKLQRLIRDADAFTTTNCGWGAFLLAPIVKQWCIEELAWRARIKATKQRRK